MASEEIIAKVHALSPEEQASVGRFIAYLKQPRASSASSFLLAAEQFMDEHPEILHRLSQ